MKYCNKCNKEIADEYSFCNFCGEKLVDDEPLPNTTGTPDTAPVSDKTGAAADAVPDCPKQRGTLAVILLTAGVTALVFILAFIVFRDTLDPRRDSAHWKQDDPGVVIVSSTPAQPTPVPVTVPPVTTPPAATPAPTPAPTSTPTPAPVATPAPTPVYDPPLSPVPADDPASLLSQNPSVTKPKASSWLTEYKTKYVQSTGGVSIYLFYRPSAGAKHIAEIRERDTVKVVAEQGSYSLVVCSGHRIGWVNTSLIVTRDRLIAPIPSISGRVWTLYTASGRSYRCLVSFYPDKTCDLYYPDLGKHVSSTYTLEGRRLKFNGKQFLWHGDYFKSRAEIDFANEKAYYFLREFVSS